MKVFVTGVCGQLGHDVMCELSRRGIEVVGTDISDNYNGITGTPAEKIPYISLDITNAEAVNATICEIKPDAVIHCAAWTAVDAAEADENKAKVIGYMRLLRRCLRRNADQVTINHYRTNLTEALDKVETLVF